MLVVDHVPKAVDNRPEGPIGSQAKRAQVTGAALSVKGTPWTKQADGKIYLINQKDRAGDLPAGRGKCIAVIEGNWADIDGERAFGYAVNVGSEQSSDVPLNRQILELIDNAMPDGVRGKNTMRRTIKGNNNAKDSALKGLIDTGLVVETKDGQTLIYTTTDAGIKLLENHQD